MSLLLEALKKAEKAKEEAQRRARGERAEPEAVHDAPEGERKPVLTRDNLPQIASSLEIVSDDAAAPRSAAEASALEPLGAASAEPAVPRSDEAARATAKKVFEAKFREPNARMPFYITLGALGLFAVGTIGYFWYQLRPPAPLVNLAPGRAAEQPVAAAEGAKPFASTPAAPRVMQSAISGLPAAPGTPPPAPSLSRAPVAAVEPARIGRAEPRLLHAAPAARLAPSTSESQSSVSRPAAQVHPRVEAGYAAYLAGDLTTARTDYQQALREEPGNRDALLGLAALDVRTGRYETAEALYLKLLQSDPRDSQAQAALIALRSGRSDPLATESRVKSLLAGDPSAHALNFALGNQFAQQNRWAEAQQEYFKAYAGEPDNADFAYNLAVSLDHLRQATQALEYYQRAIALAQKRGASFELAAVRARVAQLAR